ncbi:MAG: hypothetical protein WBF17_07625, partial [Phycisphaerae bacterium]
AEPAAEVIEELLVTRPAEDASGAAEVAEAPKEARGPQSPRQADRSVIDDLVGGDGPREDE